VNRLTVERTLYRLGKLVLNFSQKIYNLTDNRLINTVYITLLTIDLFFLSMKVRIIEKLYHQSNSPTVSTPLCRQQEHWIRKPRTAFPCGCNDNIGSKGNISSPQCSNVNVMGLFNNTPRRKRSNRHRSYNNSIIHGVSFQSFLLTWIQQCVHIKFAQNSTLSLWEISINYMRRLTLAPNWIPQHSNTKFCTWFWMLPITDTLVYHILLMSRQFLHLKFDNKWIDAFKFNNISYHYSPVFRLISKWCLLLLDHWSSICQQSVLPYTWLCICYWIMIMFGKLLTLPFYN
jgi:hypothetical protein